MDLDPAVLAQMAVDFCKVNPLPSAAAALLLLFLVRRNTKNMAKLTLVLLICGYSVHLLSGMSGDAAVQQGKGFSKSANLIEQGSR